MNNYVACDSCFHNFGLQQTAKRLGTPSPDHCHLCGSPGTVKLTNEHLETIVQEFFVMGSVPLGTGGFAPLLQANDSNSHDEQFHGVLASDYKRLKELTGVTVFRYGPPMWMLGMTNHYDQLEEADEQERCRIWDEIVRAVPAFPLNQDSSIFRVRLNVSSDQLRQPEKAFDTPPKEIRSKLKSGRFDDVDLPVFYGGLDPEICLHECRGSLADDIILATYTQQRALRILNLSGRTNVKVETPFDELDRFLISLSFTTSHRSMCKELSRAIQRAGYDGFAQFSYYGQARSGPSLNLSLFGYPVSEGSLSLNSLNTVRLTNISYEYRMGPVLI